MTKEDIKKFMPLMQAMLEGKTIQRHLDDMGWVYTDKIFVGDGVSLYRIKPEPRYRPFKTQEECWQEMLKHQPFGWIKDGSKYVEIVNVYKNDIEFSPDADDDGVLFRCFMIFESVLKQGYTFIDGTPFGIKEE